jgi:hypothetical protein
MWSLCPRCQLEPELVDFHESNDIKPKSLSARAAEVKLGQNKTSSQKNAPISKTSGWQGCLQ